MTLLGLLNSSTACFWMKQVLLRRRRAGRAWAAASATEAWDALYEFDGTKLKLFPIVDVILRSAANLHAMLDSCAAKRC